MAPQPKYIMQPDLDKALSAFTGYINPTINMTKADICCELIKSENRLQAQFNELKQQLDRIETVEKASHQLLQIMLEQFSKVNSHLIKISQKLGIE